MTGFGWKCFSVFALAFVFPQQGSAQEDRLQQPAPRPPIVCGPNEVPCETGFCFDRTCGNRNFPALKNGRCRCANGLRRDNLRRCVDNNGCLGRQQPQPNDVPVDRQEPRPQPAQPADISIQKPPTKPPPVFTTRRKRLQDLKKFHLLWSLYSTAQQDHFYTTDATEMSNANNRNEYVTEEAVGRIAPNPGAVTGPCPNLKPLVRLYEAVWAKNHFYTTSEAQVKKAAESGYVVEGNAGLCVTFSPACGADVPLHRFWNANLGDHIYVTKLKDFELLRADEGWAYEGVECYLWPLAYPDKVVEEERQYFLEEAARSARESLNNRVGNALGPERQPGETEAAYRARLEIERQIAESAAEDARRAAAAEAQRLSGLDPNIPRFPGETEAEYALRVQAEQAARGSLEAAGDSAAQVRAAEEAARQAAQNQAAREAAARAAGEEAARAQEAAGRAAAAEAEAAARNWSGFGRR